MRRAVPLYAIEVGRIPQEGIADRRVRDADVLQPSERLADDLVCQNPKSVQPREPVRARREISIGEAAEVFGELLNSGAQCLAGCALRVLADSCGEAFPDS